MNKRRMREIERDLVALCIKHDVTISSGYALGQPLTIESGSGLLMGVYEASPKGVKYDLHDKKFRRRYPR